VAAVLEVLKGPQQAQFHLKKNFFPNTSNKDKSSKRTGGGIPTQQWPHQMDPICRVLAIIRRVMGRKWSDAAPPQSLLWWFCAHLLKHVGLHQRVLLATPANQWALSKGRSA